MVLLKSANLEHGCLCAILFSDSVHKEQPKINKNIHGASTSKKQPADDEMDDSYGDDTDIDTDNEK